MATFPKFRAAQKNFAKGVKMSSMDIPRPLHCVNEPPSVVNFFVRSSTLYF